MQWGSALRISAAIGWSAPPQPGHLSKTSCGTSTDPLRHHAARQPTRSIRCTLTCPLACLWASWANWASGLKCKHTLARLEGRNHGAIVNIYEMQQNSPVEDPICRTDLQHPADEVPLYQTDQSVRPRRATGKLQELRQHLEDRVREDGTLACC